MGQGAALNPAGLTRRSLLASALAAGGVAGGTAALVGCTRGVEAPLWQGGWVGAPAERGHRLRGERGSDLATPAVSQRASVLVLGAGIAGLSAARALIAAGVDDIRVIEIEDQAGGNSRGHAIAGIACPLGAHYLPLPGREAHEVQQLLHELGLARQQLDRIVYDERHLCHSPQERLFIDGAWHEGLLPPADAGSATLEQYRRFAAEVADAQQALGFAIPTARAPWGAGHTTLDAITFGQWLDERRFSDSKLRWFLDYCCRDDYGASAAFVSAWAGLHYFASRHGFQAPDQEGERDAVLTWSEGNAWLTTRLAPALGERLLTGQVVLRVVAARHEVQVDVWNVAANRHQRWTAAQVVVALPLFVARRVIESPPEALVQASARMQYAPWLVANLHLNEALLERPGAPAAWDNVRYGSRALGYVDAMHQSTRPHAGPTVLTAYHPLGGAAGSGDGEGGGVRVREGEGVREGSRPSPRASLLERDWRHWAQAVVDELASTHPDLARKTTHIDLMRYGHAMSIPAPGLRSSAALAQLAQPQGRLVFAHSDLSAYSVFEEAYIHGQRAAGQLLKLAKRSPP